MNPITNLTWYLGNRALSTSIYLGGLGAARDFSRGAKSSIQGAIQLPYDFYNGVVNNEGFLSFSKGVGKTAFGIGQSMIDSPLETALILAGSVAVGKLAAWKSERWRQYKRDEEIFKSKYGVN